MIYLKYTVNICNIISVFTVTFDQFNMSFLNKSIIVVVIFIIMPWFI